MPKCFINSVRGYKDGTFWNRRGDFRNVMLTRSGLAIRTAPVLRSGAITRSAVHEQTKSSRTSSSACSPSSNDAAGDELNHAKSSSRCARRKSTDYLPIITRYLLLHRGGGSGGSSLVWEQEERDGGSMGDMAASDGNRPGVGPVQDRMQKGFSELCKEYDTPIDLTPSPPDPPQRVQVSSNSVLHTEKAFDRFVSILASSNKTRLGRSRRKNYTPTRFQEAMSGAHEDGHEAFATFADMSSNAVTTQPCLDQAQSNIGLQVELFSDEDIIVDVDTVVPNNSEMDNDDNKIDNNNNAVMMGGAKWEDFKETAPKSSGFPMCFALNASSSIAQFRFVPSGLGMTLVQTASTQPLESDLRWFPFKRENFKSAVTQGSPAGTRPTLMSRLSTVSSAFSSGKPLLKHEPGFSDFIGSDVDALEGVMSLHELSLGLDGAATHRCKVCSVEFSALASFKTHILALHCQHTRNQCAVCNKHFSRSWLLKGHMRTHTGERPFKCEYLGCERAFADKSNLRSHTLIHLADGKQHRCYKCGRAFAQKRYLHKHQLEVCKF